jgi:hypothetical protein
MNETLLHDAMHDATDDVHLHPDLLEAAVRGHGRWRTRRRVTTSVAVLMLAGGGAAALAASAESPSSVTAQAHSPEITSPAFRNVSYVAARLSATLAEEKNYLITSEVTRAADGTTLTTWLNGSSGDRRLLVTNADRARLVEIGIEIRGRRAELTTVDHTSHTVTRSTESAATIGLSSRMGVNVPSPSEIRDQITSANLVNRGLAQVDGHRSYRLRLLSPMPAGSEIWAPGVQVELYVDVRTYRLVRMTVSDGRHLIDTDDVTWTPLPTADLGLAKVDIPEAYTTR